MTLYAVGLAGIDGAGGGAAKYVFLEGDHFQVIGVHAKPIPAQVVNLHPGGNLSVAFLPNDAVRE